jgi:hypothetical protein
MRIPIGKQPAPGTNSRKAMNCKFRTPEIYTTGT